MKCSFFIYTLFVALFFSLVACKKDVSKYVFSNKRTVLVIMEANNNLKREAFSSINGMEKSAANLNGTLLVYIKSSDRNAYLLKIKPDNNLQHINSDTIKVFENKPFSSALQIKEVIQMSQNLFPSSSYGLVLWSHATSWAPPLKPRLESFGYDRGEEIDIFDLKDALPNNLDYIIFDACSMSSLEVLTELKNKAKYIIASPSETIAESYPYHQITPLLFNDLGEINLIAEGYFNYYNSLEGLNKSATVAVINTAQLDLLCQKMSELMISYKKPGDILLTENIQRMDFSETFPVPAYDFADFIVKNFPASTERLSLLKQLKNVVPFHRNTPFFIGKPINSSCGVTCFIPSTNSPFLSYFKKFAWYQKSAYSLLFNNI